MKQKKTQFEEIELSLIDSFPDHPFKVEDDLQMIELAESIKNSGLLLPVLVRKKYDGRYEMISGHRRLRASEMAGNKTIKAMVFDCDDNTAAIIMVESNVRQREKILPSEKAFAYQMMYAAMKHQGKRTDLTSATVEHKLSRDELAKKVGESGEQIRRYIRLTNLIPELLNYVDDGNIAMRPAVELSYLDAYCQRILFGFIDENIVFPSHDQAIRMRKLFEEGRLNKRYIRSIMSEAKPNQIEKYKIRMSLIKPLLPQDIPYKKIEDYIYKALKYYNGYLSKNQNS